ncbi:TIGR03619 family F420-dependent LLM class oxidoreductase [Nakamurella lactea]|uniref:TIGR03619 family F420-dependent LLM class oxidoreductase n=1 Tax=Nakamurella lactea TaxID=459515 RepID=UPI00041A1191|nr:TIGR03619 family F420-dependent LLM class oxidoreductase [Nakamurella lactea]
MRTGISSPVLADSGPRPDWEAAAGVEEIKAFAQAADRLGYEFLTCPDHVAVPPDLPRGERFYDPLATFSYLAALTERIRFLPYVLVLPFYHPLELAKRYGTLDHLSGGRLNLGLGVGNLQEEFDLLGAPFDDRGARADDALRALRASLGRRLVSYRGPYYGYENLVVSPHAAQQRLPMWIGGHSMRALRRAVELADGWTPAPPRFRGPDAATMKDMLTRVERPDGFDVVMAPERALDPVGDPAEVRQMLERAGWAGATVINLAVRHSSLAHYLEQLDAYARIAELPVA